MKNYFLQFRSNAAKNKAQEELQAFAYTYKNTLADNAGIRRIADSISKKCYELNAKYPRCKPMAVFFNDEDDSIIGIIQLDARTPDHNSIFYTSAYEVYREEFESYSKIRIE